MKRRETARAAVIISAIESGNRRHFEDVVVKGLNRQNGDERVCVVAMAPLPLHLEGRARK